MPLPFSSAASPRRVRSHDGGSAETTRYKSRDVFFFNTSVPSTLLSCWGRGGRSERTDNEHTVQTNGSFCQAQPPFFLLICYDSGAFFYQFAVSELKNRPFRSRSYSFMEKLQLAFLWPAEVEGGGGKSCLHPFSHFPCFSFLIFCFHSIIIITSCQKYYWPQQSESQRGDTW